MSFRTTEVLLGTHAGSTSVSYIPREEHVCECDTGGKGVSMTSPALDIKAVQAPSELVCCTMLILFAAAKNDQAMRLAKSADITLLMQ